MSAYVVFWTCSSEVAGSGGIFHGWSCITRIQLLGLSPWHGCWCLSSEVVSHTIFTPVLGFILCYLTIRAFGSATNKFWKPKLTFSNGDVENVGVLEVPDHEMEAWFGETLQHNYVWNRARGKDPLPRLMEMGFRNEEVRWLIWRMRFGCCAV